MTREEAIRELKQFSGTTQLRLSANFWEALDRAIKSLEQEHCEDCVSRKTVLNTLNRMDSVLDEDRTVETYKELLIACYNDLPSVTPTPLPSEDCISRQVNVVEWSKIDDIKAEIDKLTVYHTTEKGSELISKKAVYRAINFVLTGSRDIDI